MKRILIFALAICFCSFTFTACSGEKESEDINSQEVVDSIAIFKGVISEIDEKSAIVDVNADQEHILSSGDKVSVNLSISQQEFVVGDEIVVYYSGEIMESYPLQVNVSDIELLEDFEKVNNEQG